MGHRRMLGKGGGQSFFFDTFPVAPTLVFCCRKLTSNAGSAAFDIHNNGNVYVATVYWNTDGTLTGASATNNITYPTLNDLIAVNLNRPMRWYEQMSGGSEYAEAANVNVQIKLDTNGNAYYEGGAADLVYTTLSQHSLSQPITVVTNFQFSSLQSSFKSAWRFFAVDNTTFTATHSSTRFAAFGSANFGTARTITGDIFTAPTVVQMTGDGASGNVWVNNVAQNPANMGTNGSAGKIRFGSQTILYSDFIVLNSTLTTGERTDLYNKLNGYYVL